MTRVIRFILVDDLWRLNHDALLPLGDFEVSLEEVAYDRIPEPDDLAAELAAEMHRGSIQHWATRFADYVGREEMIPRKWALVAATDALAPLEDGHHRLAAAKVNGLRALPVAFPGPGNVGTRERYARLRRTPLTTGARRKGAPTSHDVDPLDRFSEAVAGFARRYATGRRGKATPEMIEPFIQFYRHGRDVLDRTHEGRVALGMLSDVLEQTTGDEQYHDRGIPCLGRYPGGKCQSSDWIVPLLPDHRVYVEMFGGIASVLLRKPRSEVEIYNDVSGMLAETLATLAHEPAARRLQSMALDYAANGGELADRFFELREVWHGGKSLEKAEPDLLMRVLVFLYGLRLYQTPIHAERMTYEGGLGPGQNALQMQRWLRLVLELSEISARTAGVVVFETDWKELVRRLEKSAKSHKWKPGEILVYCDPPYPEDAVSEEYNALYGEDGSAWGPASHNELVQWAARSPWKIAISGMLDSRGNSPYRELERKGFRLHKQKRRRSSNQKNAAYTECLWIRTKANRRHAKKR